MRNLKEHKLDKKENNLNLRNDKEYLNYKMKNGIFLNEKEYSILSVRNKIKFFTYFIKYNTIQEIESKLYRYYNQLSYEDKIIVLKILTKYNKKIPKNWYINTLF